MNHGGHEDAMTGDDEGTRTAYKDNARRDAARAAGSGREDVHCPLRHKVQLPDPTES